MTLRIMAPPAAEGTAFKKNGRTNSWSIVYCETLDVKNYTFQNAHELSLHRGRYAQGTCTWVRSFAIFVPLSNHYIFIGSDRRVGYNLYKHYSLLKSYRAQ